jgi:hypothetical protein
MSTTPAASASAPVRSLCAGPSFVHGPVHRREHAKDKGDSGAQTRAQEREGDERGAADHDRDGRGERVLAKRHARLPVQKRVVECVDERASCRGHRHHVRKLRVHAPSLLGARPRNRHVVESVRPRRPQ